MEFKRRKKEQKWIVYVNLSVCVLVFLSVSVVNAIEQDDSENLPLDDDVTSESVIDSEINNIDDPEKTTNYAGYVVGRVVDLVTTPSSYSFSPYISSNDVGRMFSLENNRTHDIYGDNSMWDGLFRNCETKTTFSCVKKNVYKYIDRSIAIEGDFPITDSLVFTRNGNEIFENKYDRSLNNVSQELTPEDEVENTTEDTKKFPDDSENSEQRSYDSFYSLTNTLYDRGVKFIMTHDLELQLPDMIFDGAKLRISPKALEEDGGALLKLEVNHKKNENGDGRILFKKHKKKLMMAFFAIMMVIKMIKVKLMFLLPMLLGVGAAKKIFLKILLFIFPAFAHIFKFCAYYHATHSKFHHHHHQVAHHHHHVPVHVPVPVHVEHSHNVHVDHHEPPHAPSSQYGSTGPSGHDWDSSGPGYVASRSEYVSPSEQLQENELESWGLMSKGSFHVPANVVQSYTPHSLPYNAYTQFVDDQRVSRSALPVTESSKIFLNSPEQNRLKSVTPSQQLSRVYVNNQQRHQQDLLKQQQKQQQLLQLHQQQKQQNVQNNQFSVSNGIQQHKVIQVAGPAAVAANQHLVQNVAQAKLQQQQKQQQLLLEQQKQQFLRQQQLKALTPKPPIEGTTIPVTYDPFFSPILQKMDNVFVQLGFNEEACRERLVCSMYKIPERFSPHSNLISAQLSRDPQELQKPAVPNSASVRFHRYVQAARDGQDRKDCLKLYPACTVNTE